MTILDKLLEKKDIYAYIEFRVADLKSEREKTISDADPEDREYINERFKGRIAELATLRTAIKQGKLKETSKDYCRNQ